MTKEIQKEEITQQQREEIERIRLLIISEKQ